MPIQSGWIRVQPKRNFYRSRHMMPYWLESCSVKMVNVFSCLHKSEAPAPSLTNDLRICQALTNLYKEVRIALELIKKKLFSIETKKNHTLMWNMDGSSVRPVGSSLETSLEHDGVEEEEKKKGKRRRRRRKRKTDECRLVDKDV